MPWNIEQRDGRYCVVKQGESSPVPGGCHDTRAQAIAHQRALYANEPQATTAAGAPLKPPRSFFEIPEPNHLQPLQVHADGSVSGHLAPWDSCHVGFLSGPMAECVKAPRSTTDYSLFHLGQMQTAEGDYVAVGKITAGTGHAPVDVGMQAASAHYDNTGSVAAFVRASNGRHGIWLSGVKRSDLSAEAERDLLANSLSGDWRHVGHGLELVAALSVVVPGFPVPRSQMAMAASGEIATLILANPIEEEAPMERSREYLRKRSMLSSLVAAPLSTERRNNLPDSAFALPGRRYPIHDAAHARNALARSAGKPEAAQVRRAVCRRFPEMGECQSNG